MDVKKQMDQVKAVDNDITPLDDQTEKAKCAEQKCRSQVIKRFDANSSKLLLPTTSVMLQMDFAQFGIVMPNHIATYGITRANHDLYCLEQIGDHQLADVVSVESALSQCCSV